jgi:hypothetical protein
MFVMLFFIITQICNCYVFIEQVLNLTVIQYHMMSVGRRLKLKEVSSVIVAVSIEVYISSSSHMM